MPFSSFSFSFSFDDDDGEEGDDIGNHLVTSKRKRNTNRYQCGYRTRVACISTYLQYILCAIN